MRTVLTSEIQDDCLHSSSFQFIRPFIRPDVRRGPTRLHGEGHDVTSFHLGTGNRQRLDAAHSLIDVQPQDVHLRCALSHFSHDSQIANRRARSSLLASLPPLLTNSFTDTQRLRACTAIEGYCCPLDRSQIARISTGFCGSLAAHLQKISRARQFSGHGHLEQVNFAPLRFHQQGRLAVGSLMVSAQMTM
jgi:hypothetical protein